MGSGRKYPSLFQINTRVWLRHLSRQAGRPVTLADVDETVLAGIAERGFDWVWLLGVWQTGAAGRAISRGNAQWHAEFARVLPDLSDDDICGSCFAITGYTVHAALGGDAALASFRRRLAQRGIRLLLDFVPNHTAPDHPWADAYPEYYVQGDEAALLREPANYVRTDTGHGSRIFAHGRDPNYPGWPDTLQLDYTNSDLQAARIDELLAIAGKCDGVRCDMAMLMLPEVFARTWGRTPSPFWPGATSAVRARYPDFMFMAEVYWDLEWTLQQQGFDYCYDKRLYDRLKNAGAGSIRDHLHADLGYQDRLARFLENHDEPRAATAFDWLRHQAAAIVTYLSPGLRFFHQGQFDGARVRIPVHLCRGPDEMANGDAAEFYTRLLRLLATVPAVHDGAWQAIEPQSAWQGNPSCQNFVACAWSGSDGSAHVVVVNFGDTDAQCRLRLPFPQMRGRPVRLTDAMGAEIYDRDGNELLGSGLYIAHRPWQYNVFALRVG